MRINTIELKGKPLSLGAKILGCTIAVGALVLKASVSPALDIDAAIKVAAFVVVVFAPVDLSLIFGSIFGTRTTRQPVDYYTPSGVAGGGK